MQSRHDQLHGLRADMFDQSCEPLIIQLGCRIIQ